MKGSLEPILIRVLGGQVIRVGPCFQVRISSCYTINRHSESGGQVRDEYRDEYDPGRGGYGKAYALEQQKAKDEYGPGRKAVQGLDLLGFSVASGELRDAFTIGSAFPQFVHFVLLR